MSFNPNKNKEVLEVFLYKNQNINSSTILSEQT